MTAIGDLEGKSHENITIHSLKELQTLSEVYTDPPEADIDYSTPPGFSHSNFSYLDEKDHLYFGQSKRRKHALTPEEVSHCLQRIPDARVYPPVPPSVTIASTSALQGAWIKRPKMYMLDDEDAQELCPVLFQRELQTCEFVRRHPHPGVVRYLGCVVKRGVVTGIGLERCVGTLQQQRDRNEIDPDVDGFVSRVTAGVQHLHSLGLAHNDLNPMNIGIRHDGSPVVLDLGSCERFGDTLLSGGTPGWADEIVVSRPENDYEALERLTGWLKGTYRPEERLPFVVP